MRTERARVPRRSCGLRTGRRWSRAPRAGWTIRPAPASGSAAQRCAVRGPGAGWRVRPLSGGGRKCRSPELVARPARPRWNAPGQHDAGCGRGPIGCGQRQGMEVRPGGRGDRDCRGGRRGDDRRAGRSALRADGPHLLGALRLRRLGVRRGRGLPAGPAHPTAARASRCAAAPDATRSRMRRARHGRVPLRRGGRGVQPGVPAARHSARHSTR